MNNQEKIKAEVAKKQSEVKDNFSRPTSVPKANLDQLKEVADARKSNK